MKIAVIAPVLRPILNQQKYGGIERIIKSLVLACCRSGDEVFLYAPTGTDLKHSNLTLIQTTDNDRAPSTRQAEINLFKRLVPESAQYDLVHSHIEPIIAQDGNTNYLAQIKKPVVVTFHNQTYIKENIAYYKKHKELWDFNYVFISRNQAKPLSFLPNQTVIYNGINVQEFHLNLRPDPSQLAFLGRITPEKGIEEAITIAQRSDMELKIAALIDKSEQSYYRSKIKPLIDNKQIIFLGEVDFKQKEKLLGESCAYLFPIKWQEPFGLTVVESLAFGTPVVAFKTGSMPEIIEESRTGFLVNNTEEAVTAIKKVDKISRADCRESVEKKFSEEIMVRNYRQLYKRILGSYFSL